MQFVNLTERLTVIEVTNAPSDVRFFIVQVHSFVYNLTLSSTPEKGTETYIKGTNVGLVALNTPDATFYIQDYNSTVTVLISVIPYEDKGNNYLFHIFSGVYVHFFELRSYSWGLQFNFRH